MTPENVNNVPGANVAPLTFSQKFNNFMDAANPYMAIAGAGANMISGAIGGGFQGFTESIPIVGGIFKSINAKKAQRRAERERKAALAYQQYKQTAAADTAESQAEYEQLYGSNTALTSAKGGEVKTAKIWLNDGEVVYHPDGTVKHIPKKGRKVDSVLSDEPVGSYVFGGLTNPRTGNKFQDDAKILKPTKGKLDKRFDDAKVTRIIADTLFDEQEMEKAKQGVTPKTKKLPKGVNKVQAAAPGDKVDDDGTNNIVYKRPNTLASTLAGISNLIDQRSILSKGVTPQEYHSNPYAGIATRLALRRPSNIQNVLSDINRASRTTAHDINKSGRDYLTNARQRIALANTTQRNVMDAWNNEAQQAAEVNRNAARLYASLGEQDRAAIYKTDDINARRQAAYDNAWQQYGQNAYNLWKSVEDTYNKYNYDKASLQAMAPFWEYGNPNKITFGKPGSKNKNNRINNTTQDIVDMYNGYVDADELF